MSQTPTPTSTPEYLIIGAGPAGLQLGYFLKKSGREYLILESGSGAGTFYTQFPRHRTLISINKVHTGHDDPEVNLRWDWNSLLSDDGPLFRDYSSRYFPAADDLVRYLADFAAHHALNVQYDTRVTRVSRDAAGFQVTDADGRVYRAPRVVVATGYGRSYTAPIPGIELAEEYSTVSVEPRDFVNQDVLILGKGNSAFETADNLVATAAIIHVASPRPVQFAWKTHFVGHLRAVNNNFLDTYQLKSQNAVLDCTVERIRRRDDGKLVVSVSYSHANGEHEDLVYDRVIACTGFGFDASIFDENCRPELTINDRFPKQTSAWESTSVEGLFFAGALMHMRDFKKHTSGFIHGFRYNVRTLQRLFEARYHGVPLAGRQLAATPERLVEAVLERVNRTSGLWQQFGFLCDVLTVSEDGSAEHVEELPLDYVHDSDLGEHPHYYTLTLEFGKVTGDPFAIERHPDARMADRSTFLHPVVRRYAGSELIGEVHLIEDLYAEWTKPEMHVRPLTEFFEAQMELVPAGMGGEAADEYGAADAAHPGSAARPQVSHIFDPASADAADGKARNGDSHG
jgi:thioredoxin reductase